VPVDWLQTTAILNRTRRYDTVGAQSARFVLGPAREPRPRHGRSEQPAAGEAGGSNDGAGARGSGPVSVSGPLLESSEWTSEWPTSRG
jgi:hypothetical protein